MKFPVYRDVRPSLVLQRLAKANPKIIQEYHCEPEHGHWLYLNPGWICPRSECGTIRQDTVKLVLEDWKTVERITP